MSNHLQILLGLNCNFKCKHCLNESGPGIKSVNLAEHDIDLIMNELVENKNINKLGFSGGEPLLYVDAIQKLVELIGTELKRDIKYTLTTNGSLIEKNLNFFRLVKFDSIVLSFDKWHLDFITDVNFKKSVQSAKKICPNIEISFVYDDDAEIKLITDIAMDLDVKVIFSKVVKSGRFEKLTELSRNNIEYLKCPNMSNERKNADQYLYYPSKGYSICCGPLAFSTKPQLIDVFAGNTKEVVDSGLYATLTRLSKSKIKKSYLTDCDNCNYIFSNKTILSKLKMLASTNLWENFTLLNNSSFTDSELKDLDMIFHPKYFYVADVKEIKKYDENLNAAVAVEANLVNNPNEKEVNSISDFIKLNFYKDNLEHYDDISDMEKFYEQQKIYFGGETKNIVHIIDGKIIAVMTVCKIMNHKYLNESVWHVGYWGILKEVTDKKIRSNIKNSWSDLLIELNLENKLIVGIDYFNQPSSSLAEKLGYKKLGIRFDPR